MQTAKVVKKIEKIKLTPISPSEKFKKSSYCILIYNSIYYEYALGSYGLGIILIFLSMIYGLQTLIDQLHYIRWI